MGQWAESVWVSGRSHCGAVGGVTEVQWAESVWVSGRSHLGSMLDSSRSALVFSTVS